jgi:hypothetical protein
MSKTSHKRNDPELDNAARRHARSREQFGLLSVTKMVRTHWNCLDRKDIRMDDYCQGMPIRLPGLHWLCSSASAANNSHQVGRPNLAVADGHAKQRGAEKHHCVDGV